MKSKLSSSFRHAFRGMRVVFVGERNFRIQITVALIAIVLASVLSVKPWEFILIVLLSASILTLELFNTVVERMADGLSPRLRPIVRDIKDMMAAAVLLVSLTAAIVGLIIFLPYLQALMSA